jgi:hypothetical protein
MLSLRYLLGAGCFALFACVAALILYDIFLAYELGRLLNRRTPEPATGLADDAEVAEVPAPGPHDGRFLLTREVLKSAMSTDPPASNARANLKS